MAAGTSVQGRVLAITVLGCSNLSNTQWIGTQDPYVLIDYAGQERRTQTCTDGGRNPSFNQSFQFALIAGVREINASVWNSNTMQRNDYIGSTTISLNKVIESVRDHTHWTLTNNRTNKTSGVLNVFLHVARTIPEQVAPATEQGAPPCGQGPPAYAPGPPAYNPGPPAYALGPPAYASGPPAYAPGPPAYALGPPAYASGPPAYALGPPAYASGPPAYAPGPPAYALGPPAYASGPPAYAPGPPAHGLGAPGYGQGVPPYGQGVPASGAAVQSYYPQQQPYPPPTSGGYEPPPAAAHSYMPIYQAPAAAPFPPQPVVYVDAQSSCYPPPSAPPLSCPMYPR